MRFHVGLGKRLIMVAVVPLLLFSLTPVPVQETVAFLPGMRFSEPLNYPVRALARNLQGDVVLSCAVLEDGVLEACAVVSESARDVGFGPAAVRSANGGQLSALASQTYAGTRVSFSVKFRLAPDPLDEADDGTRP